MPRTRAVTPPGLAPAPRQHGGSTRTRARHKGLPELWCGITRGQRWLFRPWRFNTLRRAVDVPLAALSVVLPAAIAYAQLAGETVPSWLQPMAQIVAGLWVATVGLRALELVRDLYGASNQYHGLQNALVALEGIRPPIKDRVNQAVNRGALRRWLAAVRDTEDVRATVASGSGLVLTYLPAIIVFLSITASPSGPRHGVSSSSARQVVEPYLLLGIVLLVACALLSFFIVRKATAARELRQAVDDSVRGKSSSAFNERLEIGCVIGSTASSDGGWHKRTTTNMGDRPLMWRTLGIGSSDKGAYRYRRFAALRIKATKTRSSTGTRVGTEVRLVPIGRPLDEGTTPLLEYAAFFDPAIDPGETVVWQVDFDWPHFSDQFRLFRRDYYSATFEGQTTRFTLAVDAPWPLTGSIISPNEVRHVIRGKNTKKLRCQIQFASPAARSDSRRVRIQYGEAGRSESAWAADERPVSTSEVD